MAPTKKELTPQEKIRRFEKTFQQASEFGWRVWYGDKYEEEKKRANPKVEADDEASAREEEEDEHEFSDMDDDSAVAIEPLEDAKVDDIVNDPRWAENEKNSVARMRRLFERVGVEAEASGFQDDELDLSVSTNCMDEGLRYGSDDRQGDKPATAEYIPDESYGEYVPVSDGMGGQAVDTEGKLIFKKLSHGLTEAQKKELVDQNKLERCGSLRRRRDSSPEYPINKRLAM